MIERLNLKLSQKYKNNFFLNFNRTAKFFYMQIKSKICFNFLKK
jgi:hypothetical protein